MKKYGIVLLVFLASCSIKNVEQSLRQVSPVVLDSTSEFGEMYFYDPATGMFYSISNYSANLYLSFLTKDENIQRQIKLAGTEVWMDTSQKLMKRQESLLP